MPTPETVTPHKKIKKFLEAQPEYFDDSANTLPVATGHSAIATMVAGRYSKSMATKILGLSVVLGFTHQQIRGCSRADGEWVPSRSGVKNVLRRPREGLDITGSGKKRKKMEGEHWLVLKSALEADPRLRVLEMQELLLEECSKHYSRSTILRALKENRFSHKDAQHRAQQRGILDRMAYLEAINSPGFDSGCAIFIDESHFAPDFARRRGWGPVGCEITLARLLPRDHSCSYMAARNIDGALIGACQLLGTALCGVGRDRFLGWFRRCALPILGRWGLRERSSILLLDNARIHQCDELVDLVEPVGAKVVFLPP